MERDANLLASKIISEFDTARFYARLLQPVEGDKTEEQHVLELLNDDGARNKAFAGVMESYHNAPGAEPAEAASARPARADRVKRRRFISVSPLGYGCGCI